jgi:hypothetical protein
MVAAPHCTGCTGDPIPVALSVTRTPLKTLVNGASELTYKVSRAVASDVGRDDK